MPAAVGAGVIGALGAAGASATVAAVVGAIAYAATAYALNKALESLTRKPGKSGAGSGLEISVIDSTADGRIIYGSIRTSGVNVIPPLTSSNPNAAGLFTVTSEGAMLHQVLALAIHECASFGSWYLDEDEVLQADITAITGTNNDGKVNGTSKYKDAAWLRGYTGTASQAVDKLLNTTFPSNFTSDFRGRGITYVAGSFDWGKGKVYTGGQPNLSIYINGKKCYDPRLDSSPGADPTNVAYIAHTSCPALIWSDYKMSATYGQGVSASDIDWATVVSAANVCDALVVIPTATTQKRYTFNGVLSANDDVGDNEKAIVDAMMGKYSFSGGKHRIFAGAWRAAEFSIQQTDWVSISVVQAVAPRNESRFNGTIVYHVDQARKWQRVEAYRRFNDTYKSADGAERIWIEMDQPYTMTGAEAQRKGEFLLRQSRNGARFVGTLPPSFMRIRTWDNVALTFADLGWVSKTFTVANCTPRPDGAVDVVLTEEQDTDWTDLLEAEYDSASVSVIPNNNPPIPTEPSSLSLTTLLGTLQFDIGEPVIKPLGTLYQILQSPGTLANPSSFSVIWEGQVTRIQLPGDPRIAAFYHSRCRSNSYFSNYQPNTFGVLGQVYIPPESMPGNRAYPDGEFTFSDARYWATLSTGGSTASRTMVSSGGLSTNHGFMRVIVSSNAAPIDGEEITPLNVLANSAWSIYGAKVLPKQRGTAYVSVRNVGSPAFNLNFRGYMWQADSPGTQPPFSPNFIWSNSLAVRTQNSGAWVTYVMSFTVPDSGSNHVGIRAHVVPGYTGSLATLDIGAMQIVLSQ